MMQPKKSLNQQPVQQHNPHRRKKSSILPLLFGALLLAASVALFYNKQAIIDQVTVWRFTPSSELVSLANRAGLNDEGKFYLYASQAEISSESEFNTACGSLQNERTVVLGCYTGNDGRIYIYDVTDTQLDGVRETTAAHEMLHAAYDRLSNSEKDYVDGLLEAQEKTITDSRLLNLIAEYKKSEPNEVVNELHSIFGTEVRSLSPELEAYYKKYFANREEVVALKEKYEKVFTDLAAKQTALVNELNSIASEVNTRQKAYELALSSLNADIESFNQWAQSGVATKSQYNAKRAELEARISGLDAERVAINAEIDSYNAKKAELDKLNIQAATLNQSIDSKLSEAPSAL